TREAGPEQGHSHAAPAATGSCEPSGTPLGALPPAVPVWCAGSLAAGPGTAIRGKNSWVDDFDHGLSNAEVGPDYKVFGPLGSLNQAKVFRHNSHWMVDINGVDGTPGDGPWNVGGVTMRPDQSFRFVDGRLVIEADVAAGIAGYGGSAWP